MATLTYNLSSANIPTRITGELSSKLFSTASFWGLKSFNISGIPINNLSTVYLGLNSGETFIPLTTGASYTYTLPASKYETLSNFWVNGNTGNSLYINFY